MSNVNILISWLDHVVTYFFSSFSEILRTKTKVHCKTIPFNYLTKNLCPLCLGSFKYLSVNSDKYLNDSKHKKEKIFVR